MLPCNIGRTRQWRRSKLPIHLLQSRDSKCEVLLALCHIGAMWSLRAIGEGGSTENSFPILQKLELHIQNFFSHTDYTRANSPGWHIYQTTLWTLLSEENISSSKIMEVFLHTKYNSSFPARHNFTPELTSPKQRDSVVMKKT